MIGSALLTGFLFSQTVSTGGAAFLDDWLKDAHSTSGNVINGQSRGFASGGSFSMHVPSHNDALISTSPPKFSVGCGGVDANLGSISWLTDIDITIETQPTSYRKSI